MVESFFVPYYAEDSGEEKMVLFTNGKEYRGGDVFPPESIKDGTGQDMERTLLSLNILNF